MQWKAFATAPGETFFYDVRVGETQSGSAFTDKFSVYLKTLGDQKSLLAEVSVACSENNFSILSGVYREEARGWVANIEPGSSQVSASNSPVAILRTMLCATSSGNSSSPADVAK